MKTVKAIGNGLAFGGIIFLVMLFLFDQRLHIPAAVQVIGRMHPLLLHFPIVLILISFISYWIKPIPVLENTWEMVRLFAAVTAIGSAIMGLLLSKEQTNGGDIILWHKWSGISLAAIAWILYQFHEQISQQPWVSKSIASSSLLLLVMTGHWGATLTHGEDYLTQPLMASKTISIKPEEAEVYAHAVGVILQSKCGKCHQGGNKKGALSMEDSIGIVKGGKSGSFVVAGDIVKSLLFQRLSLPMDDKKHMPPPNHPQLSPDEILLLQEWVKAGMPFKQKILERPEDDSLRIIATAFSTPFFAPSTEEVFAFQPADASTVNKLRNNYRVIKQIGQHSPALAVSFYGRNNYTSALLQELEPIKTQIIQLYVSKMPVSDKDVQWISKLPNLKRLNLNYSDITDQGLQYLVGMQNLHALSVSGTAVTNNGIQALLANKHIKELYVWDSKVTDLEFAAMVKEFPGIKIDDGFIGLDTMKVQLNLPTVDVESGFLRNDTLITIKHPIKGVTIKYTLDGTDPDSANGINYTGPVTVSAPSTFSVKAFKPKWVTSNLISRNFLKVGYPIVQTKFIKAADSRYNKDSANVLTDLDLGDPMDKGSKWLGFINKDAEVQFDLGEVKSVKNILINALDYTDARIFPPIYLGVLGSKDGKHWEVLQSVKPQMPDKNMAQAAHMYTFNFPEKKARYVKLIGKPLMKAPKWHQGSGKSCWFFVNEIVVN
jgi:uncharacterized membrane protein